MPIPNIDTNMQIGKSFLPELFKEFIITVFDLCLHLFNFR